MLCPLPGRATACRACRPLTLYDRVATLEEAKAQLRKSWGAWKVWAKLEVRASPGRGEGRQTKSPARGTGLVSGHRWP